MIFYLQNHFNPEKINISQMLEKLDIFFKIILTISNVNWQKSNSNKL